MTKSPIRERVVYRNAQEVNQLSLSITFETHYPIKQLVILSLLERYFLSRSWSKPRVQVLLNIGQGPKAKQRASFLTFAQGRRCNK